MEVKPEISNTGSKPGIVKYTIDGLELACSVFISEKLARLLFDWKLDNGDKRPDADASTR